MARVFGWKAADVENVIKGAVNEYGIKVNELLAKPTAEWTGENTPRFIVSQEVVAGDLIVRAGPDPSDPAATVYRWVTRGTKEHPISVVNAENLVFWHFYKPSTTPGSWASNKSGNTKSLKRVTKTVTHPGAVARKFEEMAAEELGPGLAPHLQLLMTILFNRPPFER